MTDNVTMETGTVICGRCGKARAPLVVEEIKGLAQLRAGDWLLTFVEARCLYCGWKYRWNIHDKDAEKMTVV